MSWIARISDCLDRGDKGFAIEALAGVLPQEWVGEALEASGVRTRRRRRLPCSMTVWLIILLGLFRRHSYRNLLGTLEHARWVSRFWENAPPPSSSALTKARDRVGVESLRRLYRHSAQAWVEAGGGLWFHGRRVRALDGYTLKTWDSVANREYFGVPGASRGAAAFPQLRVVSCMDLGTRVIEATSFGPYAEGELTLARRMQHDLPKDSLILMDRNFTAYGFLWDLKKQGLDFVVRAKHNMKADRFHEIASGDALVRITIPRQLRRARPDLPKHWTLREIVVHRPGARDTLRLFTTLLAPSVAGPEVAALYLRRWDEETAFDEFKTHLGDAATVNRPLVLRSRRPMRVEQEIYGLLIAYNAVRRLMADAADEAPTVLSPLRLSFTGTLERLREAIRDMTRLPPYQLADRYAQLLQAVARHEVPERPGRSCPRAVCIKMSGYPLKEKRHVG